MRQFIEYKVYGKTIAEIAENAEKEWRDLTDSSTAVLPRDTEILTVPTSILVTYKLDHGLKTNEKEQHRKRKNAGRSL